MEPLEIRALLAANTLDFVDNLSIDTAGDTRDLQLVVGDSSSKSLVGIRISGTSGNLDPNVPLVFVRDTDRNNPANHVPLMQALANANGTQDSLIVFEVDGGDEFTIQVGGSSGAGDFRAEVFLFGSTNNDGSVSELEYMQAVAAELQARGAGNHNTAAYFQRVYGINLNHSQYNAAFDANANGKVDGFEVNMVAANKGKGPIVVDLIGDNDGPAINVSVAVDTGASNSDDITSDVSDSDGNAVVGTIVDQYSDVVSATVSLEDGAAVSFDLGDDSNPDGINFLEVDGNTIEFGLSASDLETLLGGTLEDGTYTLIFNAVDSIGNETEHEFTFTVDTTAPGQPASLELVASSDTGHSDTDNITSDTTPTFTVLAEAGAEVEIFAFGVSLGFAEEAEDNPGTYSFTVGSPALAEGTHEITVVATDIAGNVSVASTTLEVVIDTNGPVDPSGLTLVNNTTAPLLTDDAEAEITGTTEVGALVRVLDANGAELATATADANGDFTITGADLVLGKNELTVEATDAAGNPAEVTFTVWRNTAPTIDAGQILSIDENSAAGVSVGQVSADGNDTDDVLTYAIIDTDTGYEGAFTIDAATGEITVANPSLLNFETLEEITLTIRVTDSYGDGLGGAGLIAEQTVTIQIDDVNEAPTVESETVDGILENTTDPPGTPTDDGALITTLTFNDVDDGDTLTFDIISGNEDGAFAINNDGEITVADASLLDFEANPTYTLTVELTDSGNLKTQATVTINLANVNESPSLADDTLATINENADGLPLEWEVGDLVGTIDANDPDADDTFTYVIVSGNDNNAFAIDNNGNVTINDPATIDFETTPQYNLEIQVADADGLTSTATYTINVDDLNDRPTVDQPELNGVTLEVDENAPAGTDVTLEGGDIIDLTEYFADADEDGLTFTITGGNTGNVFAIEGNKIVVAAGANLNYEALSEYTLTITATDPEGLTVEGTVDVTINNLNELPVEDGGTKHLGDVSLLDVGADSVNELILSVNLIDPEGDDLIYSIGSNENFSIDEDGNIYLDTAVTQGDLDAITGTRTYTFTVNIQDNNSLSLPNGEQTATNVTITFTVTDNDPPIIESPVTTQFTIEENIDGSIIDGANLTPELIVEATDPEGDEILLPTIEPSSGNPNPALAALFEVIDDNGVWRVVVANAEDLTYNFVNTNGATDGVFEIDLVVTDENNRSSQLTLTITVLDLNNTPEFEAPAAPIEIAEFVETVDGSMGTAEGDVVLNLDSVFDDEDNGTVLTYTLESATVNGVDISDAFVIVGNEVQIADASLLDFETLGSDDIVLTITANDGSGEANNTVEGSITVQVTDENELPIIESPTAPFDVRFKYVDGQDDDDLSDLGNVFDEGILSQNDPEGDTVVINQRTGTTFDGEQFFEIDAAGNVTLKDGVVIDFTGDSRDFILVFDYNDGNLDSDTDLGINDGIQLVITVTKNAPPTFTSADNFDVDENTVNETVVHTVVASDQEGEAIVYAIDDPTGAFTINAETGVITVADSTYLDAEQRTSFDITISATDEANNVTEQVITVTINNVNDVAPEGDDLVIDDVTENTDLATPFPNGSVLGTVVATDGDEDPTPITYEIVSGNESGAFSINANGDIIVADASQLDYDTTSQFVLEVVATDENGTGLVSQPISVTINLENVNEAPELTGTDFNLPRVYENELTGAERINSQIYVKTYTNDEFNFAGQFVDPEGDDVELTATLVGSSDYIQSVEYDNDANELRVTFFYYAADQDRSPAVIQISAADESGAVSSETLQIGVSVNLENSVDLKFIPVASPTSSTQSFVGLSEAELPTALSRVADEQTFVVEMWGTTLVGQDDVAAGRAWVEGIRSFSYDMNFRNDLLIANAVYAPLKLGGTDQEPVTINNGNGTIINFNLFFGNVDSFEPPFAGIDSIGYNGEYVRLGYIEFTVKSGEDTGGMTLDDLVEVNFASNNTAFLMNGADDEDVNPAGDDNTTPDDIPGTVAAQAKVNTAQLAITSADLEIVDATTFTITEDANVAVVIGPTGSKIGGSDVAAQIAGADMTGVTGKVFVLLDDPDNPTTMEIIGSEFTLENSSSYAPGAPTTNGGDPIPGGTSPANLGLTAVIPGQGFTTTTNVAIRETTFRFGGSPTIAISGNASDGGATFNSADLAMQISNGWADVSSTITGTAFSNQDRESLFGQALTSRDAENGILVGDGLGAFTLEFNLRRMLNQTFNIDGNDTTVQLLFNSTIVAEVGGGVPLHGTVFAKDGQPLEDGSGVFLSVVKNKTQVDANGQVAELPENAQWASEWDTVWVEVWGNTADALGVYGGTVDLGYDTSIYTATEIEYAGSMSANRTGTIDDAAGKVFGLGSETELTELGNGSFVLLGRVKLESVAGDGIDVAIDDELKGESLGLSVDNAKLMLTGYGVVDAEVAETPNVEVWGMAYDIDNDGRIGLSDFNHFIQHFGSSSLKDNDGLVAALDFDNNGTVGLTDFNFFIQNFGRDKADSALIQYPETFTQTWVGRKIELDGPDSLTAVFDRAVADWQEALGWDEPLDVKLVVKDYGNAQLGEAQLLALDENGMPEFGILTLDDDGAGLGWSSDLAGGPAEGQYDLYTVILHELGHLYGFMSHYSGFADNVITDHEGNQVFYSPDFTALMDDYAHHLDDTAHAGDVMNGLLDPGTRKMISALDVQILQTAYASAQAGASVNSGTAALHANVQGEMLTSETTVSFEAQPLKFAFDKVVDVETVSGQTGFASTIDPRVQDELNRNGIRVTTSTLPQFQQRMDEIDSAVATFLMDDQTLVLTSTLQESEELSFEEQSTDVDSLFADWDMEGDLDA